MARPLVHQKKARALSSALFLVCLAITSFMGSWWPEILLTLGLPIALRQLLMGRYYDMFLSLLIFVGAFIIAGYDISWNILLPAVCLMSAIYIVVREFCDSSTASDHAEETYTKTT